MLYLFHQVELGVTYMNVIRKCLTAILLLPGLVFAKTLIIAVEDYPPHTSSTNKGHRRLQQPVTQIFEELGYEVKYEYTSWARAIKGVKSGKFDITFPWFESKNRRKNFILTNPLMTQKVVFFHRADTNFDWDIPSDLRKYSLGTVVDYTAREVLIDLGLTPLTGNTDTYVFRLLYKGRIDAYPATIETAIIRINQIFDSEQAKEFTFHDKALFENDMYLLFNKERFEGSTLPQDFNQLWLEHIEKHPTPDGYK